MNEGPDLALVASLVGDSTRAAMLSVLMDGRAYTATELALEGHVAPSTASEHLGKLISGGLLILEKQGRHRYFRIRNAEIAGFLEILMVVSPPRIGRKASHGPNDARLRKSRVCYDHLAGELAVHFLDRCREERFILDEQGALILTAAGRSWCDRIHVDIAAFATGHRPLCRSCLDWSERRPHLGGALGAAFLEHLFRLKYARREPDSRAVILTDRGTRFLDHLE